MSDVLTAENFKAMTIFLNIDNFLNILYMYRAMKHYFKRVLIVYIVNLHVQYVHTCAVCTLQVDRSTDVDESVCVEEACPHTV